jgi:alkylation response protein AidB-like acyl-CoA dehydrogenase
MNDTEDLNPLSDESFRLTVRQWIEANYPEEMRFPPQRLRRADNRFWYDMLSAKGWIAPNWPREYGGMGLSGSKQLIMHEEIERHGCARLNDMGLLMVGPLLIRFGTEAQKRFFLPRILTGEFIWCQGYSEPDAGSDLASLRTEAVRDGEHWVVNGQKTWATLAQDANWVFLLARTDKAAKKQQGISFLLAPMDSPGISVRTMDTLDLHAEFSEIFFDQVRVPAGNLVGEVNQGWSIAKALLGFERIFIGSPKHSAMALKKLKLLIETIGVADDPLVRDHYVRLHMDLADLNALYEVFADKVRRGEPLGAGVSMLKVFASELYQRITDALLDVGGESAALLEPMGGNRRLNIGSAFLQARPSTIYGGSNEIQRGILAKEVLDLAS